MSTPAGNSVVVGIDPSDAATRALDWAADEAARRGVELRIAHSWGTALFLPETGGRATVPMGDVAAEKFLEEAAERVRTRHSGLTVSVELLPEEPVTGLLRLSWQAALLVVGARGLNRFSSLLLGSVSQRLVTHAACPVVVVRGEQPPPGAAPAGEIVLGAAPGEPYAPVEFAFAEASWSHAPLRAVRTWMYPQTFPGYITVPPNEEAERDRAEREELATVLLRARTAHPDVQVVEQVALDQPEAALVEASRNASLVVVGARRHRPPFALPLAATVQRVLHHAHCPVAVVPV